ncbi:MAG: ADP-glyceromanno-heptose 6-epimerase [Leptospiraceae bacterium]|nr:ADP-glyceromanno-heptose 6-epimerase [Leptospiraceae bacterium]MCP5495563.1 ADP-glyceromanno-heptose 6-epimerase [Leptospiraceae bacterium]
MSFKYIVTGGAGLIGSNVVKELNQNGENRILIVDHLGNSEKWKNLTGLSFVDYLEKDDFLARIKKDEIIKDIEYCIHLGACSSTTEKDATYLIANNYEYTKVLSLKCIEHKKRFLCASSAATYGIGENGYDDKKDIEELRPLNMYGYSKQLFDLYANRTGILKQITSLKYFNVFGYGEAHKGDMRSVVLKGYEQIKQYGKLNLFKSYKQEYKDGEQKRDFLYVKDAAKITIYLLLENHNGIYNIGRGVAETWNDLAKALFDAMKLPFSVEYIDMPEHLKEKYQYYTKAEMDKLNSIGYSFSFTTLQDAIADYVRMLDQNKT